MNPIVVLLVSGGMSEGARPFPLKIFDSKISFSSMSGECIYYFFHYLWGSKGKQCQIHSFLCFFLTASLTFNTILSYKQHFTQKDNTVRLRDAFKKKIHMERKCLNQGEGVHKNFKNSLLKIPVYLGTFLRGGRGSNNYFIFQEV